MSYSKPIKVNIDHEAVDMRQEPEVGRPSLSLLQLSALNDLLSAPASFQVDPIGESSFWLGRQSLSGMVQSDLKSTDPQAQLKRLTEELDSQLLEFMALEQQIQSISLKCKSIREAVVAKSNAMHKVMMEMNSKPKQTVQKQTQTDFPEPTAEIEPKVISQSKMISHVSKVPVPSPVTRRSAGQKERNRLSFTISTIEPQSDPQEPLAESLRKSFYRLPALVKGYLTRRLMKTDKVKLNIELIRGSRQILFRNADEPNDMDGEFERSLALHLKKSYKVIHDIFFKYTKAEQMAMVRNLRNATIEMHFKNGIPLTEYARTDVPRTPRVAPNVVSSTSKKVVQRKKNKTVNSTVDGPRSAKVPCIGAVKQENNRTLPSPAFARPMTRSTAQRNTTKRAK